jgi:glycosyltransferase involved in cell wall biosynthesis
MSNLPFITIFTPNYNKSKFLPETIESVLNQTYTNFEYIIVDDCSTDNSWEIIQSYVTKDNRIKAYRNELNCAIVETRNRGLNRSSDDAKYFAIIDSDDVASPDRIQYQVEFLEENPEYGLVGSDSIIIDENSQKIGYRTYPHTDAEIRKKIVRFNPFTQSSITIRKEVVREIGPYDEQWKVCQDYDYWLRVGKDWKLRNLEDPLIKYRLSSSQVKITHLKETVQNTYRIQKKAIKEYGYKDNFKSKIFRFSLKISLIYPKIAYFFYKKFVVS